MSNGTSVLSIYVILIIAVVIIILIPWIFKKGRKFPRQDAQQRDTDLRLTYKRFMELYPYSGITYQEYKQMQAKHAYRRAVSSMRIKRMVR